MNYHISTLFLLLTFFVTNLTYGSCLSSITGGQIVEDITLNVPEDYADIQEALYYLDDKKINSSVYVTIQVADGAYTNYSTVLIQHPNGDRIKILGNTSDPSQVSISFSANQYGFRCDYGSKLGLLDGFTIFSNGTGQGIMACRNSYITTGDNMIIDNFWIGINASWNSIVLSGSITIQNNQCYGVWAQNATIYIHGATVKNNSYGVVSNAFSHIQFENGRSENNTIGIASWKGSHLDATGTVLVGNNTDKEILYSGIISE